MQVIIDKYLKLYIFVTYYGILFLVGEINMPNVYDYLKWRGDLSFQVDPFNEIDALILSEIAYVEFNQVLSSNNLITLKDVAESFLSNSDEQRFSFIKDSLILLKECAKYSRFSKIKLANYVNELDYQNDKQFAAITFYLNDHDQFVAFRGTDDTILGWKEDFQMTYLYPVESQIRATNYLKDILESNKLSKLGSSLKVADIKKYPKIILRWIKNIITKSHVYVGGHSKGGNLAVYAVSNLSNQLTKKITTVYNFDGPGFNQTMIKQTNYQSVTHKIRKYIPENSVFGIMLESLEPITIVKSDARGIMQHSGLTWQIIGTKFEVLDSMSFDSKVLSAAFDSWLDKVDLKTRENAIKTIFTTLDSLEIKTIDDLTKISFSDLFSLIKQLTNLDDESRNAVIVFFKTLITESTNFYKLYHLHNPEDNS